MIKLMSKDLGTIQHMSYNSVSLSSINHSLPASNSSSYASLMSVRVSCPPPIVLVTMIVVVVVVAVP